MNVASLELCRELYELSGWEAEKTWAYTNDDEQGYLVDSDSSNLGHDIYRVAYAYDLSYLLRKAGKISIIPFKKNVPGREWEAYWFKIGTGNAQRQYADTPEDAACKLAIELFKQGVLK